MSVLLSKINANPDLKGVASELQRAGLCTDSEIRSLTREELHELFPGSGKLKLRRTIFEIINKPKPVHVLTNELKAFIPHDVFRAAQTGNGVLADYLVILKDLKTQLNEVQGFIDAHIDLLEQSNNDQLHQEPETGPMQGTSASETSCSVVNYSHQTADSPRGAQAETMNRHYSGASEGTTYNQGCKQESPPIRDSGRGTSGAHGHVMPNNYQTGGPQQGPQKRKYQKKVTYQVVVSGKALEADKQLMNKVLNDPAQNQVQFVETHENHQITILFCPVSSRIGTDVDAALGHVKDDKPVILVVMHHEREPNFKSVRIPNPTVNQIVLHVNVFYHDSEKGLLTCKQNDTAASEIQKKLLKYSTPIDTSGNSQGARVESGRGLLSWLGGR